MNCCSSNLNHLQWYKSQVLLFIIHNFQQLKHNKHRLGFFKKCLQQREVFCSEDGRLYVCTKTAFIENTGNFICRDVKKT